MDPKLDHIGVAVESIAAARVFYQALGLQVTAEEAVEHEQVRVAMLPAGDTRLELIEPAGDGSAIANFLARHGPGLHHIALRVESIDAVFAKLQQDGVRLAGDAIRVGAGGHRYFFVHPSTAHGVLIEIVGEADRTR